MAGLEGVLCYVHGPRPPYERIAGPIYPVSVQDHTIGHSVQSTATLTLSPNDLIEPWMQPGMCWVLESSIGEDPWAGFVRRETVPFQPSSISLPLVGPKEALLDVEIAIRLPVPMSRGFAIRRVLELAQELDIGLFPGIIEQEGAAVMLDVRGETVSRFIDSIKEASAMDWRERCILDDRNNTVRFYIDFGLLKHPTSIVLERQDLAEGTNEFSRNPVPASLTVLGQAGSFAARQAATTGALSNRIGASSTQAQMAPMEASARALLAARDIGPAASRHRIEISERFGGTALDAYIIDRHNELLRTVDQVTLTLDGTRSNGRKPKLGDVVNLSVPNWALGESVDTDIHIIEIHSMPDSGKRELLCNIEPPKIRVHDVGVEEFVNLPPRTYFGYARMPVGTFMFGGGEISTSSLKRDVWKWSSANHWSRLFPNTDSERHAYIDMVATNAAAGPFAGHRAYFFGGQKGLGVTNDETWYWDGADWHHVMPITSPGARENYAMAWDGSRLLLYGGHTTLNDADTLARAYETWSFDGADWSQIITAHHPHTVHNPHAMIWDGSRFVLFGGFDMQFSGGHWGIAAPNNETWVFNGSDWVQIVTAHSPPARYFTAMAWDGTRILLFGGWDASSTPLADTWSFNGTDWTQLFPANSPCARSGHAIVWEGTRFLLTAGNISAAGSGTPVDVRDTWQFKTGNWTFIPEAHALNPNE